MLQNLHVKNLALIDEVEITFDEHLNILTGETGAGKSVLIGSIESALGKKISKDMIRPGAKEAVIELLFWIEDQKLIKEIEALDLEVEDGQIFIKRVINEKRSINKINDSTVTLNTLREVSRRLFDLHGQQEHQVLLKEKNHLSMMDHFLPENARYSLEQCKNLAGEYHEISTKIKEISIDDQQRLREMDFLKHEISEIENANLVKGEDEELETVYQKIVHSRDIIISCQAARMLTGYEEETSIGNQLSESIRRMQEISHLDPQISEFYEQLLSVEDLLNGFHQELTTYMENMEFDEQTYQEVEERLNVINSLKDKYGAAQGEKADLGDGDLDFFGFLAFLRFLYVMFLHGVLLSCCVSRFDISAARCRRRSETRKSLDALRRRRLFYIPCGLPGPEAFWPGRRRWRPLRHPSQPGHPPNRPWAPGGGRARF